jgi:hypothetical protein
MLVAGSNLLQDVDDIIPAILPMAFIVPASPNSMRTAAVFFEASTQDTKFRVLDVEVSGSHDPSLPKETKSICLKNDGRTYESAEISDVPPKKGMPIPHISNGLSCVYPRNVRGLHG